MKRILYFILGIIFVGSLLLNVFFYFMPSRRMHNYGGVEDFLEHVEKGNVDHFVEILTNKNFSIDSRQNYFIVQIDTCSKILICPHLYSPDLLSRDFYKTRFFYMNSSVRDSLKECGIGINDMIYVLNLFQEFDIEKIRSGNNYMLFDFHERDNQDAQFLYGSAKLYNIKEEEGDSFEQINEKWSLYRKDLKQYRKYRGIE